MERTPGEALWKLNQTTLHVIFHFIHFENTNLHKIFRFFIFYYRVMSSLIQFFLPMIMVAVVMGSVDSHFCLLPPIFINLENPLQTQTHTCLFAFISTLKNSSVYFADYALPLICLSANSINYSCTMTTIHDDEKPESIITTTIILEWRCFWWWCGYHSYYY